MSFVLNMYNYHCLEYNVTNRSVKTLLTEHFGNKICFMYLRNMKNSQMFSQQVYVLEMLLKLFVQRIQLNYMPRNYEKNVKSLISFLMQAIGTRCKS